MWLAWCAKMDYSRTEFWKDAYLSALYRDTVKVTVSSSELFGEDELDTELEQEGGPPPMLCMWHGYQELLNMQPWTRPLHGLL